MDLLFLDIELVRENGISVGRFIRGEMEDMYRKGGGVFRVSTKDIANQLYASEYAYDCVKMSDGTVFGISKPYRKEIR